MHRLAVCGTIAIVSNAAFAKKPSALAPAWDPAAAAELKAQNEKMFADIDAWNTDALTKMMNSDGVIFDVDPNNVPVAKHGAEEIKAYMDQITTEMKAAVGTVQTTVVRDDCFAVAVMGYCAVEFDQMFTMGGNTMGPMKFRGTKVARKLDGAWKWDHWHGSYREQPPMPATTTPPAK